MRSGTLVPPLLGLLMVLSTPAHAGDNPLVPRFIEETRQAGIDSTYTGEWEYMVGGGVAAFDCNGDGLDELLLSGGDVEAAFYINRSSPGGPLSFQKGASGLELRAVVGAYPLDIDGDGKQDIVLLRSGENVVMRGLGDCRFERANEAWGFAGGDGWSTALAATWEKGATFPTIAIGNYIDRYEDIHPWGSCTDNWLHRPAADGTRRFGPPEPLKPSFCPLSMLFTDWNRSGTPSLRVSNDREYYKGGQEQMWHVEPGKPAQLYTAQEGWKTLKIWGMGIASHDLNGDGLPEYFLTSMADNKLQTLSAMTKDGVQQPVYKDVALSKGVTAHRPYTGGDVRPSTAWHAQFADANNDGRSISSLPRAMYRKCRTLRRRTPTTCFCNAPTELSKKRATGPASPACCRDAAPPSWISISMACSTSWWSTNPARCSFGATRRTAPGTLSRSGFPRREPTAMPWDPGSRFAAAMPCSAMR